MGEVKISVTSKTVNNHELDMLVLSCNRRHISSSYARLSNLKTLCLVEDGLHTTRSFESISRRADRQGSLIKPLRSDPPDGKIRREPARSKLNKLMVFVTRVKVLVQFAVARASHTAKTLPFPRLQKHVVVLHSKLHPKLFSPSQLVVPAQVDLPFASSSHFKI